MVGISKSACVVTFLALTIVVPFASVANAQATQHRPVHKKLPAPALAPSPLPPGVELHSSTSAAPGTENRYFSDTVAAGQNDLLDQSYRYGQPSSARYGGPEPLFRF